MHVICCAQEDSRRRLGKPLYFVHLSAKCNKNAINEGCVRIWKVEIGGGGGANINLFNNYGKCK